MVRASSSKPNYSSSNKSNYSSSNKQSYKYNENNIKSKSKIPPPKKESIKKESYNGGFLSSIMDGFSFGFGSSIAHRVVGGIFGSEYQNPTKTTNQIPTISKVESTHITSQEYISKPECSHLQQEYIKCIQNFKNYEGYESECNHKLDIFKDCELY